MLCQSDESLNISEMKKLYSIWLKIQTWFACVWWCGYNSILQLKEKGWEMIWISAQWSPLRNNRSDSDDIPLKCYLWGLNRSEIWGAYQEWQATSDHQSAYLWSGQSHCARQICWNGCWSWETEWVNHWLKQEIHISWDWKEEAVKYLILTKLFADSVCSLTAYHQEIDDSIWYELSQLYRFLKDSNLSRSCI